MIFLRAAQREFAQTAAAIFVALFAIMLTTQLIRLLAQAAGGKTASEAVAALLGFASLNTLPVLLSLTLFVAILLSLSRVYRDSEMVVWFSSGVSLFDWIRPVLRFSLPVVFVIAVMSLFLTPWANDKRDDFQDRMDQRGDLARVSPGAFRESAQGDRVFFVESITDVDEENSRVKNVFINSMQQGRMGVMVAANGYTETAENGDVFIVLNQGRRYEGTPGTSEHRIMEFERYSIRMETKEVKAATRNAKNMSTLELIHNWTPSSQGEILWRIGVPLSALALALLAIPLSFVNPRAGRTNNLIYALLTFVTYSNLLSVSQAWVAQGRMPFVVGVWAVHAVMFIVLSMLFWKRMSIFSVWRRWR